MGGMVAPLQPFLNKARAKSIFTPKCSALTGALILAGYQPAPH